MVFRAGFVIAVVLHVFVALMACEHALLTKRDTRAVAVISLTSLVGAMLYIWLGVNRIASRTRSHRADRPCRFPSVLRKRSNGRSQQAGSATGLSRWLRQGQVGAGR